MIVEKPSRSVVTLSANPWDVIHPVESRTPIAASFSSPTQIPVRPSMRPASIP